jgi:hypothetical protein
MSAAAEGKPLEGLWFGRTKEYAARIRGVAIISSLRPARILNLKGAALELFTVSGHIWLKGVPDRRPPAP